MIDLNTEMRVSAMKIIIGLIIDASSVYRAPNS